MERQNGRKITIFKGDKMTNRVMRAGNDLYHTECVVRERLHGGKLIPIEVGGMVVGFRCECGVKFIIQEFGGIKK